LEPEWKKAAKNLKVCHNYIFNRLIFHICSVDVVVNVS